MICNLLCQIYANSNKLLCNFLTLLSICDSLCVSEIASINISDHSTIPLEKISHLHHSTVQSKMQDIVV